ncbi:MAG: hypothetical protein H6825_05910 [Planctomycetes bacterium]|nr:hypothetical protein [Planctomycetota bacterium]
MVTSHAKASGGRRGRPMWVGLLAAAILPGVVVIPCAVAWDAAMSGSIPSWKLIGAFVLFTWVVGAGSALVGAPGLFVLRARGWLTVGPVCAWATAIGIAAFFVVHGPYEKGPLPGVVFAACGLVAGATYCGVSGVPRKRVRRVPRRRPGTPESSALPPRPLVPDSWAEKPPRPTKDPPWDVS